MSMSTPGKPGYKYVATLMNQGADWDEIVAETEISGSMEEMFAGLRPWLLTYLGGGERRNGWYTGRLLDTDEYGDYDTYLPLAMEDVVWYWDEELGPLSRTANLMSTAAGEVGGTLLPASGQR